MGKIKLFSIKGINNLAQNKYKKFKNIFWVFPGKNDFSYKKIFSRNKTSPIN